MKTQHGIILLAVIICFVSASPALAYYQAGLNCEITDGGLEPAALKANWWLTSSWGLRAGYDWGEGDLYAAFLHKERAGTWMTRYFGLGFSDLTGPELSLEDNLQLCAGLEADLGKFVPGFSTALEIRLNPASLTGSSTNDNKRSAHIGLSLNYRFLGPMTDDDLYLLAKLITAESQGEPYEGQVAVGAVVLNRVKSSQFPNTIREVIYQKNQFSCLPKLPKTVPTESSLQAAEDAIRGEDPSKGALFYYNPRLSSLEGLRFFATADLTKTVEIGNHIFFK
jgi:hypothetical protein